MKPLSAVDASFLYMEKATTPMHVGGLHLFSYPEDAGDDWLQGILADLDARDVQPPFDQKLAQPLRRLRLPYWTEDAALDLDYHVRHSALPRPGRYRELFSLISRLHSTQLHRDRPLWEMHFIEGVENNRFALYGKMHHALVDGMSATRLFRAAMSTDPYQRDMPPMWAYRRQVAEGGDVSRGALRAMADNIQSQVGAVPGAVRGLASFAGGILKRGPHGMVAPYNSPRTSFNRPISAARRFVAQSWSLTRIKKVAKKLDATVNDIVLAMSSSALRQYLLSHDELPKKSLTAMAPVSVRPADSTELGNAVSAILVSLATDVEDAGERLRAIQQSIGAGKALLGSMTSTEILLYTNFTALPSGLPLMLKMAGHTRPPFNLTISNVPGPRENLYWNGAKLEGSYPVSIVVDGSGINITVTSFADSLDFGIIACRRSVPRAQRLIDYLEAGLQELEVAAG